MSRPSVAVASAVFGGTLAPVPVAAVADEPTAPTLEAIAAKLDAQRQQGLVDRVIAELETGAATVEVQA